MLLNDTLQRLRELRLAGMAAALEEQLTNSACAALGFEERFALALRHSVWKRALFTGAPPRRTDCPANA